MMPRANAAAGAIVIAFVSGFVLCPPVSAQTEGEAPKPAPTLPMDCQPEIIKLPKAKPDDYPRLLQQARKLIEVDLDYERAQAILTSIGVTDDAVTRAQVLELSSIIHLIEGRAAVAQPMLEELYFLAPAFVLRKPERWPDRVNKMFEEEAARPHKRGVSLELLPWGDDRRGFLVKAGGATSKVETSCGPTAAKLAPIATSYDEGNGRFRLPSLGTFYCTFVARDRDGLPLGRLGTAQAPITVKSRAEAEPEGSPLYEAWWFWVLTVGVTGGVTAGVVVGVTQQQEIPPADVTVDLSAAGAGFTILRW